MLCMEKAPAVAAAFSEDKTMSNDRMTVVPDFLGELDAGVFMNKIAAALSKRSASRSNTA